MTGGWLDVYDRRARLKAALLSALPLALSVVPLVEGLSLWWAATSPLIVYCGGAYLLAQLARDRGKRIEPRLYRSWAGPPTTRLLRHRGARNPVAVEHRHATLAGLLPHLKFPSPAEEAADPVGADHTYEAAVAYLRDATRDRATFPLVFAENCNYGFRRNLLGLRWWAVGAAVLGLGLAMGAVIGEREVGTGSSIAFVGALALDVVALFLFAAVVRPPWVKVAGDAYAERLLGAADQLRSVVVART